MADERSDVEFIFDFISPYAYLAWTQVRSMAARHGRGVAARPALFAAMLGHHGHLGPAEIPPKREYIFKNVLRLSRDLGVPLTPPPAHPFNPLLALRVASVEALDEPTRAVVIDALFKGVWGAASGPGVESAEAIASLLAPLGLDVSGLLAAAVSPENKARLRAQTDAAIAAGAFGVPTLIVDGELFWGLDAFPHVEAFLRGEDPIDPGALARWRALPSSARRPR